MATHWRAGKVVLDALRSTPDGLATDAELREALVEGDVMGFEALRDGIHAARRALGSKDAIRRVNAAPGKPIGYRLVDGTLQAVPPPAPPPTEPDSDPRTGTGDSLPGMSPPETGRAAPTPPGLFSNLGKGWVPIAFRWRQVRNGRSAEWQSLEGAILTPEDARAEAERGYGVVATRADKTAFVLLWKPKKGFIL